MRSILATAAALALGAGLTLAQNGATGPRQQSRSDQGQSQTEQGKPTQKAQTYNTGSEGRGVGKDTSHPYTSGQQARTVTPQRERRGAGTGVATGFVAAGVGLALLGLFVRRRNRRHPDDPRYHDDADDDIGPTSGPRV